MAVGIFANCVFFLKVNRLSVLDKKKIKSHIQENGGVISFVLNEKCSHIIVDNIDALSSYKLKTIQKYQIPVLLSDFIQNCVEERRLLQADDYVAKKSVQIDPKKGTESQGYIYALEECEGNQPRPKQPQRIGPVVKGSAHHNQEKSQVFETPKDWKEKDTDSNRIYTKDNLDPTNLQDVEIAKYAVLEKVRILTDLKEMAVVELQQLPENYAFLFRISANFGLSNGSQKETQFLQVKTSKEACESYDVYLEDLKKKDFTLKEDVPQEAIRFASEMLQEQLLEEARNTSSLSPETYNFVELIWVEALGHLDHILRKPVNSISLNDVSKGEGILFHVRKALDDGASAEVLKQMMMEFYRIIPHKNGIDYNVNKKLLSSKEDLCQLIRDMVNVCETSMSSPNPPALAKYRALRCKIDYVGPDSDEFLQVEHQVLQNNHSDIPVKVLQVYRVGRMNETAAFQSKYGNIQSLLHSSSVCNFVGILSRGLLLPKMVVEDHGLERTDIGNLGSGIYFGDSISTCIKYSKPSETDGSRLLVVCSVALGKCMELYETDFSLAKAPAGYQSVHGVRKAPGSLSDFEDDEFVIYNTNQVKMGYIVKFCLEEDNVKEFFPDISITEVAERVPCHLQSEEISLDNSSLHKIKAGLLDTSGNSIPLKDIHIKGRIMDLIAQVVVFQTYTNLSSIPIEAKYVFPLDGTAAVCGFEAFINGKHIIGEVKEKDQAHQEYRQAVSEGHGAYLMDQDAPDVFTVSVGNLPAEATVLIKITYITELSMQHGSVCFHIPAAVAPWQQDKALKENTQDTVEKVYIKEGWAQKGAFSLDMSVEMPYKIEFIYSLTHNIKIKKTECKAVISTCKDSSLDSDGFDLRICMCKAHPPRMWVEKHPEHESEACMLVFQPYFEPSTLFEVDDSSEIVICLDCSTSMEGLIFQQAKQIALLVLKSLSDRHQINLIRFGTNYQELFSYPKSTTNRSLLEEYIKIATPTMGNTDLWKPLRSLSLLAPSDRLRNILLISDGHIQNESLTFQIIKKSIKHTRLFACGVGPTANRHMLRSLAQYGAGAFEYFETKSKYNWKDKVSAQVSRMESPGCSSISVKWQQFNPNAPEPMQAPFQIQSLFRCERVLVYGFIPHCTQATLNAFIDDEELSTMVSTTELQKTTGTLLHKLTARAIIKDYEHGILHENEAEHEMRKQELKSLIIELSKEYSIVTQFTSFVAIEERGSEITPQPDIPNIKELIAKEDIDLLPYMDWERNANKYGNLANDLCVKDDSLDGFDDNFFTEDYEDSDAMSLGISDESFVFTRGLVNSPAPLILDDMLQSAAFPPSVSSPFPPPPPPPPGLPLIRPICLAASPPCSGSSAAAAPPPPPLPPCAGSHVVAAPAPPCPGAPAAPRPPPPLRPCAGSPVAAAAAPAPPCPGAPAAPLPLPSLDLPKFMVAPPPPPPFPLLSLDLPKFMVAESDKMPEFPEVSFSSKKKIRKYVQLPSEYQVSKSSDFDKESNFSAPPPLPAHLVLPGSKTKHTSLRMKAVTTDEEASQVGIKSFQEPQDLDVAASYSFTSAICNKKLQTAGASKSAFQSETDSDRISSQRAPSYMPCMLQVPVAQAFGSLNTMEESQQSSMEKEQLRIGPSQDHLDRQELFQVPCLMEQELMVGSACKSSSSLNTGLFGSASGASTSAFQSKMVSNGISSQRAPSLFSMPCMEAPMSQAFGSLSTLEESQSSSMVQSQMDWEPLRRTMVESVGGSTGFTFGTTFGASSSSFPVETVSGRGGFPSSNMEFKLPWVQAAVSQTFGSIGASEQSQPFSVMDLDGRELKQEVRMKLMDLKLLLPPKTYKMNFAPSVTSLLALQNQTGFWNLNPDLGDLLKVDVNYLCNVILAQKGIHSLGPRGKEEVLQLIATLLVLQLLRFTQVLQLITFKSLMKLDDSSTESAVRWNVQKAVAWARKIDRQYPAICSRLELGTNWDSFTRQLLRIDPFGANSPLLKAIKF
ncbi:protein mono-ADP-ribosyltransferase PARP4 [Microcaecilia unicolor]|uniref:Poly [ADP-ribose] polymerase n=1 Tax=Microcaecilia unicolor TaxID=1415580 RepID=A0A6P7XS65_9AMPH|nr:protein mono-ADP-ribosyltransferase PARP4-like [Microcaecilia unicolor]